MENKTKYAMYLSFTLYLPQNEGRDLMNNYVDTTEAV
jgi:hypothetical protein